MKEFDANQKQTLFTINTTYLEGKLSLIPILLSNNQQLPVTSLMPIGGQFSGCRKTHECIEVHDETTL